MRTIFAIPGLILSFLSLGIMLIAMFPLLGWLNWLNIPLAILALLFSLISGFRTGVLVSTVVILFGAFRLKIGFGII